MLDTFWGFLKDPANREALGSVGTVIVAVAAGLWKVVRFYSKKTRTRLKLELANNGTPISSPWGDTPDAPPCYVYHLKVTNKQRYPNAKNVSVRLAKADKSSNDGSFTKLEQPDKMLYWAQHDPDHCAATFVREGTAISTRVTRKNISGNDHATCNLGFVIRRQDKVCFFELDVIRAEKADVPSAFVLEPKERMRVEVSATGDNAKSNTLHLEITWDGKWSGNSQEMRVVRQLSLDDEGS
jgi:hypothetical protein